MSRELAQELVPNYWETPEGIFDRFGMLAEDIEFGSFNNAVKVYGTALGVTDFTVSGNLGATSCSWCQNHVGVKYHLGQFMPDLPRHPHCIHYYGVERNNPT